MKILLVFGGEGSEHDVSVMSARNVLAALGEIGAEVELAFIAKNGRWLAVENLDDGFENSTTDFHFDSIKNEMIFPLIHGRGGEDGAIAVLGQMLGVPVVGCGVGASAAAWDKDFCKRILESHGIPVVPWRTLRRGEKIDHDQIVADLKSKILFVKPAREGSSVGVSRVDNAETLATACDLAWRYDDKILVEPAISGRELECAVLGNSPIAKASDIGDIRTNDAEFYDYRTKYAADSPAKLDIPAQHLSDEIREKIRDLSLKAFTAIGGTGLARVDFFLSDRGEIYLNEINTMPGFTNNSMYPKLWQEVGISYPQLVNELIQLAAQE